MELAGAIFMLLLTHFFGTPCTSTDPPRLTQCCTISDKHFLKIINPEVVTFVKKMGCIFC
jgi:hypothetical protein